MTEIINTDGLRGPQRYRTEIVSGGIGAYMEFSTRVETSTGLQQWIVLRNWLHVGEEVSFGLYTGNFISDNVVFG